MNDFEVIDLRTPAYSVIPVSSAIPIGAGAQVVAGPRGLTGEKGDPGDSSYQIFDFNNASSVWTVNHTLGRFPDVTVLDSSGTEVLTDIDRPTISQVVITFASPTTGRVFLI